MTPAGDGHERALVLAPRGRDAPLAAALLREAGLAAETVAGMPHLLGALDLGAGLAVVAEEAFRDADLAPLAGWLARQPPWSDFPFVLLTAHGGGPERNPAAARLWNALGNVSFLERPFHPTTFVSVARAVLRGRRRQYEARQRLEDVRRAEEALRAANETLERRVAERARELVEANARLKEEIAERGRVQAELAHARRMEALGQLAGGVAHDFNNVLQAVGGAAALMARRSDDPEGVRRLARMVGEAAERGSTITRRLLAFSRRGDLRAEAVEPAALLRELREILAHTLGAGVAVRVEVGAGLPPLRADKGQLETVLVNLAANARDSMEGGGAITLSARSEPRAAALAGGEAPPPGGGFVCLAVADTGSGMPPEVLARAAEPFFTTKPPGRGTGLGLAMARGFAEQSGGALRIESAPGRGTTVRLWLPAAAAGELARPLAAAAVAAPPRRGARVLLVDDDALARGVTAEGLEAEGYSVVAAPGGEAALALLDAGEPFDLLLSDLSMPGMDGIALLREVARRRPGLPAVLLTGFATDAAEIALGGGSAGGNPFALLRKPVTAAELGERVAALLAARPRQDA